MGDSDFLKYLNKELNLKETIKHPLFILTIITIFLTIFLISKQITIGIPYYDVFVYLNNALIFAGMPVGNMSVIYLSPLIPFLTSLIFRLGYISQNAIFIIDGIIFTFGVIGLYLLFRLRFNQIQSFTGCLIYLSFPLIYTWAVSGGIDVPGVSLSIWVIYFLVLGVEKDSKYLYLVFPMFMLAFLARYTSAILVFPPLLYLLLNNNLKLNLKKISVGILTGLAIIIPFIVFIYDKLGNLDSIFNIFTSTLIGSATAVNDLGYNPDKLYFLNNILNYISISPFQGRYSYMQSPHLAIPSIFSYILAIITVTGIVIYISELSKSKFRGSFNVSNRNKSLLKSILLISLLCLGIFSFFATSYFLTELIFICLFYVSYHFFNNSGSKNLKIDFLFLAWFMAFFIFHSVVPLKEDRYFITMSPALAYFILLGLTMFIEKFKFNIKNIKLNLSLRLYLVIGLLVFTNTFMLFGVHATHQGYGGYIQSSCTWLEKNDPNYQDKAIYSNYDPAATWYLEKKVIFGVPSLYTSSNAFSHYLISGNADYYIDTYSSNPQIPGYHIIHTENTVSIYEKNN